MPTATCPGPGATAGSSSIRKSPAACTTHAYTVTSSEHGQHAAVDVQDLTVHEVGRRRGQEDQRTDQVLQLPPPPGRRSLLDPRTEFLVGHPPHPPAPSERPPRAPSPHPAAQTESPRAPPRRARSAPPCSRPHGVLRRARARSPDWIR